MQAGRQSLVPGGGQHRAEHLKQFTFAQLQTRRGLPRRRVQAQHQRDIVHGGAQPQSGGAGSHRGVTKRMRLAQFVQQSGPGLVQQLAFVAPGQPGDRQRLAGTFEHQRGVDVIGQRPGHHQPAPAPPTHPDGGLQP